jgi:hypothetical protein
MDRTWESFVLLGVVLLGVVALVRRWIVPGFVYREMAALRNRDRDRRMTAEMDAHIGWRSFRELSEALCRCGGVVPGRAKYCPRCGTKRRDESAGTGGE